MKRLGLIAGSLLGAVCVQVALVACGVAMQGDAGDASVDVGEHADEGVLDAIADTARDVAADVLDASGDAHAQDGGGCGCPTPTRSTRTFSGSFGAGTANQIRQRPSRVIASPFFQVRGGTEVTQWAITVEFYLTTNDRVNITCFLPTTTAGSPAAATDADYCTANVFSPSGANVGSQQVMRAVSPASSFTDTAGQITLPDFTAGTYRGTGIVVRITEPDGGLTTPPSAYTP